MGELIGVLIAFFVAFWVYNDAKERGSSSPLGWSIGVFLLLIVFLPLYLIMRPAKKIVISNPQLCKFCGKYYESNPDFCPNCGKNLKETV